MRIALGLMLAFTATTALAATDPRTLPTELPKAWQAKTREVFKQAIEIPSVHHRGEVPKVAKLLADQFSAAGIPAADIHHMAYEALPGDHAERVQWSMPIAASTRPTGAAAPVRATPRTVVVGLGPVGFDDVVAVSRHDARVEIAPDALTEVRRTRAIIEGAAHPSVREELWEEAAALGLA